MRKVILIALVACSLSSVSYSQGILDKAKTVASAAGFDVNTLTKSITDKLTTKLGLSATQVPKVTSAVSTFMQAKSQILPLLQTNKTAYKEKQASLLSNLKTQLAGTLVKNQMNKFLGLKPATNDASNVLSNLFY
jgi:hypothetical protein